MKIEISKKAQETLEIARKQYINRVLEAIERCPIDPPKVLVEFEDFSLFARKNGDVIEILAPEEIWQDL